MSNALPYVFLFLTAICSIGMLASLITPKAAFFIKRKTRLRGAAVWLGLGFIFFVGCALTVPKEYGQMAEQGNLAKKTNPVSTSQNIRPPADSKVTKQSEIQTNEVAPLKYAQDEIDDTSTPRRKRAQIFITLASPDDTVSPQALAATCMAAAKYYANEYSYQALTIFITDIPGRQSWEGTRLAQCSYSPDKKGWSGKQNWLWENIMVSDRSTTEEEKKIKNLWGKLRGKYQKNGSTDDGALQKAIAKKMQNISPDKITLPYLNLQEYPEKNLLDIKPAGPVSNTNNELTEDQLRRQVRELLDELDGFKNSRVFAECMFGCGANNPARIWNEKRKALQEKVTHQMQAPLSLKAAPGYLYSLGQAYHHKDKKDVQFYRNEVEASLQ